MSKSVQHSSQAVRNGLTALIASAGNASEAARLLKRDGVLDVASTTLTIWRDEYPELYADLEKQHQRWIEEEFIDTLRARARRAAEIEADLMERVAQVDQPRDVPNALRAITDAKSKSIDAVMKLTGQDRSGESQSSSLEQTLKQLAANGTIKVNVELGGKGE